MPGQIFLKYIHTHFRKKEFHKFCSPVIVIRHVTKMSTFLITVFDYKRHIPLKIAIKGLSDEPKTNFPPQFIDE